MTAESILTLIVGITVLLFGRKLFWLFVGAAGFLTGIGIATRMVEPNSELLVLVIALVAGVIGAILAILFQKVAVAAAGFLIGGYVGMEFLRFLGGSPGSLEWLAYVAGGVIGAILVLALFDWALIILSSLSGAALTVRALQPAPSLEPILLLGLIVAGIVVQARLLPPTSHTARRDAA